MSPLLPNARPIDPLWAEESADSSSDDFFWESLLKTSEVVSNADLAKLNEKNTQAANNQEVKNKPNDVKEQSKNRGIFDDFDIEEFKRHIKRSPI